MNGAEMVHFECMDLENWSTLNESMLQLVYS